MRNGAANERSAGRTRLRSEEARLIAADAWCRENTCSIWHSGSVARRRLLFIQTLAIGSSGVTRSTEDSDYAGAADSSPRLSRAYQ